MQKLLHWLLVPYRGSNRVSFYLRKRIEALKLPRILGVYLSGAAVFSAVIIPQATDYVATREIDKATEQTIVEVVATDTKLQWPFSRFGLTTRFSGGHPGVDLLNPVGTTILPIAEGSVTWTNSLPWGYGIHLLVEHDSGLKSLYAHLSKLDVKPGQIVTKQTKLGEVGTTGWATGSHVHLEIYQDNVPINPLEVLPSVPELSGVPVVPQQPLPPSPVASTDTPFVDASPAAWVQPTQLPL